MENRRSRVKKVVFILSLLLLGTTFIGYDHSEYKTSEPLISGSDAAKINNGDLIFRRGRGMESVLISAVDNKSSFTHVGLAWVRQGRVYVIHAIPDENGKKNGVVVEPLEIFASRSNAISVGVSRSSTKPNILVKIVNFALQFKGKPFDSEFDLSNQDELYCTELIWVSFKQFGEEMIDSFVNFKIPLLPSQDYILVDSLLNGKGISQVYTTLQ